MLYATSASSHQSETNHTANPLPPLRTLGVDWIDMTQLNDFAFNNNHPAAPTVMSGVDAVDAVVDSCIEEFMPFDEHTQLDFWLSGVLLNSIGIIGIAGNVLSMLILSRPQMRSSINYLLIGLARCDTVLIVTSMLLFGFRSIYPCTGYLFEYNYYIYPHIAPYVFLLATASQTASIYLTLMVSLERYVAVCHPLRAVSIFIQYIFI